MLVLVLFGLGMQAGPASGAALLVDQGRSLYAIYYARNAPRSVVLAAQELRDYLAKATGARLELTSDRRSGAPLISLGVNPVADAAGLGTAGLRPDGFRVVVRGSGVYILGQDTRDGANSPGGWVSTGTLNGVYGFLEDYVGVRWLMPGPQGEHVPQRRSLSVPELDRSESPVFENRRLAYVQNERPEVKEWLRRQRQGYSLHLEHAHSWDRWVPASAFEKHPEWFALIAGRRAAPVGDRYKLETTDPGLVAHVASAVLKDLQSSGRTSASLSPTDGAAWSESVESRALYDRDPQGQLSLTRLVLDFYDKLARRVGQRLPDRTLCGYIYADYLYPPTTGIPRLPENLCLVLAPSPSYGYGLTRTATRTLVSSLLKAWSSATPTVAYYDLPVSFFPNTVAAINPPGKGILAFLYPQLEAYRLRGIYIYGVGAWGHGALTNYLLAKLNWNPRADVAELSSDFLTAAYGPAAVPIGRLYDRLDQAITDYYSAHAAASYELTPDVIQGVYVPVVTELLRWYAEAERASKNAPQSDRLKALGANLGAFCRHLSLFRLLDPAAARAYAELEPRLSAYEVSLKDTVFMEPSGEAARGAPPAPTVTPVATPVPARTRAEEFLLRGASRSVLYPESDRTTVAVAVKKSDGGMVRLSVTDARGLSVYSGEFADALKAELPLARGEAHVMDITSDRSLYSLALGGTRAAYSTQFQVRGLHWINLFPTAYFFVPEGAKRVTLTISTDPHESAAADISASDGVVAGSLEALGTSVQTVLVSPRSGFWSVRWKTASQGAREDVWLKIDGDAPPWVFVDPSRPVVVR